MRKKTHLELSRRERQIMEALFKHTKATARTVREELPDPPSYTAVRTLLAVLEEKGHVRHEKDGRRYVYFPTHKPERARRSALRNILQTFFDDSVEKAVASLLALSDRDLSEEELDRIEELIDSARKGRER